MGDAFFYTERFKREFRDCYRADLWHWDAMMLTEGEGVEFPQSDKNKRRLPSFYLDHIESCPRCESLRQQFVEKRDFFLHKLRQVPSSEIVYEKKKSWQKTYSVWSLVFRLSWQSAVSLLLFWLIVKVPAIQFWMADFIRKLST